MGKDRRKKDNKREAVPAPKEEKVESKCQREPKQKDNQTVDNSTQPKKEIEQPDTAELFANLKKETDDIKALTTKNYTKRQVISNWGKYTPLPDADQEELENQGADFQALLSAPLSEGGHFQFKSEKKWNEDITVLSGELFALDVDLLADGLATIPLYKQLEMSPKMFTEFELKDMNYIAEQNTTHYENTYKDFNKKYNTKKTTEAITDKLQNLILQELRDTPADNSALSFDIIQPELENEMPENNSGSLPEQPKQSKEHLSKSLEPVVSVAKSVVSVAEPVVSVMETVVKPEIEEEKAIQVSPEEVHEPLQQRSNKRKNRMQVQSKQKCEQQDDALDFVLSLKKPVKPESLVTEAVKPTIEQDVTELPLLVPKQQTEDLEDWLDSMLDD